jgi:uncharacterized membrane protein
MSDKRKDQDGKASAGVLLVVRVLMVATIAIAVYLAWTSLSGNAVAGCGPDSGCDKVLHSRWGYLFGIPVSLPALIVYLGVLGLTFRLGKNVTPLEQRKVWPWLLAAATLMAGAAVWFIALQAAVIHSFCPFCMTAHGIGLLAAVVIFLNAPIRPAPEKPWQLEKQVFIPPVLARNFILFAVAGLALLALGQVAHKKQMFATQSVAELVRPAVSNAIVSSNRLLSTQAMQTSSPPVALTKTQQSILPAVPIATQQVVQPAPVVTQQVVQAVEPQPMKTNSLGGNVIDHKFEIYLGMFQFDLREVPLIGSPDAPYAMLSLFDYSCSHCRMMHPYIMQAQRRFADKLAIVSFPMPLDNACNYTVRRTPRAHTNACRYAHLGLAVWRADKSKHHDFDAYMFTGDNPPPIDEAMLKARQLIGTEAYDKAVRDPWVVQTLQRSISVYATNYLHVHNGQMPQIMIHTNLTAGTLEGPDLMRILDKQLGLRRDK